MAERATRPAAALTALLAFLAALGAACFAPGARADGTPPSYMPEVESILEWNEDVRNTGITEADVAGLRPPDCRAMTAALDDPEEFPDEEGSRTSWKYIPCVLWAFRALAEPYRADDFRPSAPILDIWNGLDLRFVPGMPGGSHWEDLPDPVYLRDQASGILASNGFPEEEGADPPAYRLHPDYFTISFKWEGRDSWYRAAGYLGRADWTGDGRADLLIRWYESAARGTYRSRDVMAVTTDGPGRPLRAIDYKDWLLANADRVRPLLAPERE